jgi:hypothetical protein
MAAPQHHRWILLGTLSIRNPTKVPEYYDDFTLDDIVNAGIERINKDEYLREYQNEKRLMWCTEFGEDDGYVSFLLHTGDKNTAGVAFINFDTLETREVEKEENEGGHYTSHILIRKEPDSTGNHLILVEKLPGIHFSSVSAHLGWLCRHGSFLKTYKAPDKQDKQYSPVVNIYGFQSKTLGQALSDGLLQDIEFVEYEESYEDGLDEEKVVKEVVHKATWDIKKKISDEQAKDLFQRAGEYFSSFIKKDEDKAHMFVRVKTDSGQIKRSEVVAETEEVLEQAFIQNEIVTDFDPPLTQRYKEKRPDMICRMLEKLRTIEELHSK